MIHIFNPSNEILSHMDTHSLVLPLYVSRNMVKHFPKNQSRSKGYIEQSGYIATAEKGGIKVHFKQNWNPQAKKEIRPAYHSSYKSH